jgi:hypothetical protein
MGRASNRKKQRSQFTSPLSAYQQQGPNFVTPLRAVGTVLPLAPSFADETVKNKLAFA